jgi:hypothetical protein
LNLHPYIFLLVPACVVQACLGLGSLQTEFSQTSMAYR